MSKVMGAVTDGGRHRMRLVGALVAAVLAAGLVPWVGADTARPSGWGTATAMTGATTTSCSSPPTA